MNCLNSKNQVTLKRDVWDPKYLHDRWS